MTDFSGLKNNQIYHDEMRIQQVILNLLTNAVKFTERGSVTIKAKDYEEDEKDYIEIDIIDTGIGI